jgi:HK97 family phage portal protein
MTLTSTDGWTDVLTSSGVTLTRDKAMGLSAFYGAVRILSNSLGKLPIHVYKHSERGNEKDKQHVINKLLNLRPNTGMTAFTLRKAAMIQSLLYGCAYIAVFFDKDGKPKDMYLLPSENTISVRQAADGTRYFDTTINGKTWSFSEDSIIELPWLTYDGKTGVGLLSSAKETLSTDYASQQYSGKFYKNGARLSGIVEVASSVSPENKDKIRTQFEEKYGGLDNAFRVGVLDLGMKYTPMGIAQKDAQYIESRGFSVEEVSRFTGVPLHKLQAGKQSYNSNEQQGLEYVVDTLLPIVTLWEQEMSYKLFLDRELMAGYYTKFNLAAEMRGDNKARAEFYEIMFRNGFYSINNVLEKEDMNYIDGGDAHFVTKNYWTLQQALNGEANGQQT